VNCPHQFDVAVYLLDALEPPEADWMRRHLPECPDCRLKYDELRSLPTLLRTLTMADVENIVAPAELPQELREALIARASARRQRRTRNRLLVASVAAAVLVAGVVAGEVVHNQVPSVAESTTVSATDPHTHMHASVTLAAHTWGTQILLRLSSISRPEQCMLVVSAVDGRQDTAATWVADYRGAVDITGTTAIPPGQISHLDVITTSGRRLVRLPPTSSSH
jgi:Putative zinc-finger